MHDPYMKLSTIAKMYTVHKYTDNKHAKPISIYLKDE